MIKKYNAGDKVESGNYWNFSNGERVSINGEGVLPGDDSAAYYRGHPALFLVAGPVLGLTYAMFLPFIGVAMLTKLTLTKVFGGALTEMAKVAKFNWRPAEAYLTGKKEKKQK